MANNMAAGPPPGQQACVEKITINLNAPPNFEIREKILGSNDQNLNYIRSETKAKISLRGRGSMFYDPASGGSESNEPLHLYLEHPIFKSLQDAKQLAKNLIETIHADLQVFLQQNNQTPQNPQQQQPPPIMHTVVNLYLIV